MKNLYVVLVLSIVWIVTISAASAQTLIVNNGESIQDAVNNAASGDTILVKSGGVYDQSVIINKPLNLVGDTAISAPIIKGSFTLIADGITIDGFRITGADAGINVNTNNNIIKNNIIVNNNLGIKITGKNNKVFNNYFDNVQNAKDSGKNQWSTDKTSGTNIIGGIYIAGNYWSDYKGKDANNDGIGDSSYKLGSNTDALPLVKTAPEQDLSSPPVTVSANLDQSGDKTVEFDPRIPEDSRLIDPGSLSLNLDANHNAREGSHPIVETPASSPSSPQEITLLERLKTAKISGDVKEISHIAGEIDGLYGTSPSQKQDNTAYINDNNANINGGPAEINGGQVPMSEIGIQWSFNDILVAGTTLSETNPDIVHDSNGNLYVAVERVADNTTRIYRSTNNGSSWYYWYWFCGGTYCTIPLRNPSLAIGEGYSDYLMMAVKMDDNSIRLFRVDLTTGGWDARIIEYNALGVSNPAIAAEEYYYWWGYIVYNSKGVDNWVLRFSRSTDYGGNWSTPSDLNIYSGYPDQFYNAAYAHPDIYFKSGIMYTAYDDYPPPGTLSTRDIYVRNSTNYGYSWNPEVRLTSSSDDEYRPVVAASGGDSGNKTAVVAYSRYSSTNGYDTYFAYTPNGGYWWYTYYCLACSTETELYPAIAASDYRGSFHVAYVHNGNIDYRSAAYDKPYYLSSWYGSSLPAINSGNSATYVPPAITTNPRKSQKDEAAIVWQDYRDYWAGNLYDIYFDSPSLPGTGGCYDYTISQWMTPPEYGSWYINDDIECNDTTITLNGDLQINNRLRLNNVDLYMNSTYNGEYSIDTYSGSTLHISDGSLITNGDVWNAYYTFRVRAGTDFALRGSTVRYAGYAWNLDTLGDNFNDAGLWINANNAIIDSSYIYSNNFIGVIFYNSNGNRITNSYIYSNRWDGIRAINSRDNYFANNYVAYNLEDGFQVSGSNNTFIDNWYVNYNGRHGFVVSGIDNTFLRNTVRYNGDIGIYASSNNCLIENNDIRNQSRGILLESSNGCFINNNYLYGNNWRGIDLESSPNNLLDLNRVYYTYRSPDASGIFLANSPDNVITRSIANNNTAGIRLWNSPRGIVNLSTANGNSAGISIEASDNSNVSNNKAIYNSVGIQLSSTSNNKVMYNDVTSNRDYGIGLFGSHYNNVSNNNATNTKDIGIGLSSSSNNRITNNTVEKANLGVSLRWSDLNTMLNNTLRKDNMGFYLSLSNGNDLIANNASDNNNEGVELSISNNNMVRDSILSNNLNYGIHAYSSTGNDLKNNTLLSNGVGVFLDWSKKNNITQSRVMNSKLNGIALLWTSNNNNISDNTVNSNGNISIKVSSSDNNIITNNTAMYSDVGIFLDWSKYNVINRNNASRNNFHGITLEWFSDNNVIMYNNASDNIVGVSHMWSSNNNVNYNKFDRNNVSANLEWSSNNNTLFNNSMRMNNYGITMMWSSTINNITRNMIESNARYGLYLVETSGNQIYDNYISNTKNAYDNGNNKWNITKKPGINIIGGSFLGGNYWNDYAGIDTDSDGLGNTLLPYNSGGNITTGGDRHPLVSSGVKPPLFAVISESPDPVVSGGSSLVTVHVTTTGGLPINGATVSVSATGGSFIPSSGSTDLNGDFKPTYTAPIVFSNTTYTISATATLAGYTNGFGSDPIEVKVRTCAAWDVNSDGTVNVNDIVLIGQHFGETTTPPYPAYDVNADGKVNVLDITIVGQHFGEATC